MALDLRSSKPLTKRKCVGVLGLLQAGKTLLLTSLINHLKVHDPDRFPLGKSRAEVVEVTEQPPMTGAEPFEYADHRARLGDGCWPRKSLRVTEYRALYARADWRYTKLDLSSLDIPGERLVQD